MLRRLLARPDAGRQAVLALLPVVMGAALLLASGERPSTESSVLETTKGPAWPMLLDAAARTSTSVAPATPAAEHSAGATIAGSLSAAAGRTEPTSGPGPDTAAESGSGTEAAGPSSDVRRDTGPGAALPLAADAPTDEKGTTTANPAAASAAAAPAAERAPAAEVAAATPADRAAEATTTTTTAARAPVPTTTGGRARDTGVEAEVVPLTNQDRKAQGLGALSRNACLDSVASGYAEKMARSGVLAHNSGAGAAIGGCRPNASWGDNVGTATPCDTARLEREWMASPGHRRNILDADYTLIGVGAWTDDQGGCWIQVLFSS